MPVCRRYAYFDHAAVSPLPSTTQVAIADWSSAAAEQGLLAWSGWMKRLEQVRETAAKLLAASPDEVAFAPNTTWGVNLVAEGFPWRDGDNLVTPDNEFPTNLYPWLNLESRGVETRQVAIDSPAKAVPSLLEACDQRTRLIAVSWVSFANGWRIDLDELVKQAHQRGVYVFLDAIQGLGVFPLNIKATPVDFLAADGHKWLLGPEGAGLFFLRREHLDLLRPLNVGWNSVQQAFDYSRPVFELREQASRYEGGSANVVGLMGLGASLDLLIRFGAGPTRSEIGEQIIGYTTELRRRLAASGADVVSSSEPRHASGIVSFVPRAGSPMKIRQHCLHEGVVLSCRDGRLRVSPHAYNNEDDMQRLFAALEGAGR